MTEDTPTFIQAVPWWRERAVNAVKIAKATGGTIVWDTEHSGLETWLLVMEQAAASHREHGRGAIVLEDDIELTREWRPKIEQVIAAHPQHVIRFFNDQFSIRWGSGLLPGRKFWHLLCTFYPDPGAILDWFRAKPRRLKRWEDAFDSIVADWLTETGQEFWSHTPSLVQHLPFESRDRPDYTTWRRSTTFQR